MVVMDDGGDGGKVRHHHEHWILSVCSNVCYPEIHARCQLRLKVRSGVRMAHHAEPSRATPSRVTMHEGAAAAPTAKVQAKP